MHIWFFSLRPNGTGLLSSELRLVRSLHVNSAMGTSTVNGFMSSGAHILGRVSLHFNQHIATSELLRSGLDQDSFSTIVPDVKLVKAHSKAINIGCILWQKSLGHRCLRRTPKSFAPRTGFSDVFEIRLYFRFNSVLMYCDTVKNKAKVDYMLEITS